MTSHRFPLMDSLENRTFLSGVAFAVADAADVANAMFQPELHAALATTAPKPVAPKVTVHQFKGPFNTTFTTSTSQAAWRSTATGQVILTTSQPKGGKMSISVQITGTYRSVGMTTGAPTTTQNFNNRVRIRGVPKTIRFTTKLVKYPSGNALSATVQLKLANAKTYTGSMLLAYGGAGGQGQSTVSLKLSKTR